MPRIAPTSSISRRNRWSRWGPTAFRAAGTTPTATTSRRASAWPGRPETAAACFAPATASITISPRWPPAKGCTSTPPYFDFKLYFPLQGLPLLLNNPFPQTFPVSRAVFGAGVPAGFAHALRPAVEFQDPAAAWQKPRGGDRLRGLQGDQSARRARHQPAASQPATAEPAAQSAVRRHQYSRIARQFDLSQPAGALSAAADHGTFRAGLVHLVEIDRRCLELLLERRRSEFSAGQLQPARRARTLEFRCAPPAVAELRLRSAGAPFRPGVVAHTARRLADLRHLHVPDRPAVHRGAAAEFRQQQHRAIHFGLRRQRPAERGGRPARSRQTPGPLVQHRGVRDSAVSAVSATPDAIFSTGRRSRP